MSDAQGNGDVRITLATLSAKLDYVLQGQTAQAAELRDARVEVREMRRLVDGVPVLVERAIDEKLASFVTLDKFSPVQSIVYGLVGVLLTGLIGLALTALMASRGIRP